MSAPKMLVDKDGWKWTLTRATCGELVYNTDRLPFGAVLKPAQIEKDFTREGRPEPRSATVMQGKYDCGAAALAMALEESFFDTKRAMSRVGWRNDDHGTSDRQLRAGARELGWEIFPYDAEDLEEDDKAVVTVRSLNYPGRAHCVAWIGGEILDPNRGKEGRLWYGPEWHPSEIAWGDALIVLGKSEYEKRWVNKMESEARERRKRKGIERSKKNRYCIDDD